LNIEGLAWDPAAAQLLLGLRSPLQAGKAILVRLGLQDVHGPLSRDNLRVQPELLLLPLEGGGIRGVEYDPESEGLLVISGATERGDGPTVAWSHHLGKTAKLGRLNTKAKPEGIVRFSDDKVLVVYDESAYEILPLP
jgi:hypothetical protein